MTTDRQLAIERVMADLGRDRYWYKVNANARFNHATRSPATRYLLREAVGKTEGAVVEWRKAVLAGKGRCGAQWHSLVEHLSPGVLALLAVRNVLDISARPMGAAAAAHAIGCAIEEEVNFIAMRQTAPNVWRDLKRRMKSTGDRRRRAKLVKKAASAMTLPLVKWDRAQCIGLGTSLIELVVQATGLVELQKVYGRNRHCKVLVVPTIDTLKWIEESHENHEVLFPFYLPTLEPPVAWENPYDGGYHTNILFRAPLVKTRSKATLSLLSESSGKMREVYSAVNAIQDTAWEINPVVFEVAQHFWRSGIAVAGIPERVDDPLPVRPGEGATEDEIKAWRHEYRARRLRVLQARSNRVLTGKCMFMAERFKDEGVFYYPHMLDFRGRAYPTPFFLQPQGSSLARGLLRFAVGGPLRTKAQQDWFMVHGANCFGVDKVSFEARIRWVRENREKILAVHNDPIDCRWWTDASKPWEFLAWCLEFAEWQEQDSFESKVPVAMDGSNNGLQLYSLLMRDPVGADATNCSPSPEPRDIYQEVADSVTAQLLADSDPLAAQWVSFCGGRIPRAAVKRQVMTQPYGCSYHSCIHFTRDWYEDERKKRGSTPFERGYGCSNYLAKFIWKAIGSSVGPARACMDWLRDIAKIVTECGLPVRWTAPTGFPVRQEYSKYLSSYIETSIGEKVRKVQYQKDTDEVAPGQHVSGVAPNFVHSLDAALMVRSVNLSAKRGVQSFAMIHDSYGVPACDAPVMAKALREAAAEMFSTDLLEAFRQEIQSQVPAGVVIPAPPEGGDLDPACVLESPYFFA